METEMTQELSRTQVDD